MDILRSADAAWQGDLRGGGGSLSTPSGVLNDDAFTWAARFESAPGTNPEELIAAAQAACLSMAVVSRLGRAGFQPQRVAAHAELVLERTQAGSAITSMRLQVTGRVPDIAAETFTALVIEAEQGCPISKLLHPGLKSVELTAALESGA